MSRHEQDQGGKDQVSVIIGQLSGIRYQVSGIRYCD